VFYVIDGKGTFVTGGKVVDGKVTAPGETRGTSINGGQVHQLSKGDVITIPAGTPHWFQKIDGSFSYFIVKVR
jgi:quercetin dioxygenase-like cupin family protein